MQTPRAGVAGPMPRHPRRSPLTWLVVAGAVGILLVIVAFAASGGLGSPVPAPIIRPDNGAAPASASTPAAVPTPTPTPTPPPADGGKHKHDNQPPPPGDGDNG